MEEDSSVLNKIKDSLLEAYHILGDFVKKMSELRQEERQAFAEVVKKAEEKKINLLKSKIDKL